MNNRNAKRKENPNSFKHEPELIRSFLENFEDGSYHHPIFGGKKYKCEIEKALKDQSETVEVHYEDLERHFQGDAYKAFLRNIKENALRYIKLFTEQAEDLHIDVYRELTIREEIEDELYGQQLTNFNGDLPTENATENGQDNKIKDAKQTASRRIFQNKFKVIIVPGPNEKMKIQHLRDLKAEHIGSLVKVKGTVVRVTEVKPRMVLAAYRCTVCTNDSYKTISGKEFMPPVICESAKCKAINSRGNIVPNFSGSKFVSYQELRIQETSDQAPVGSVPRSFLVQLNGPAVRSCAPGDTVIIDGLFLPQLQESFNQRDPLIHETFIEALKVDKEKKSTQEKGQLSDLEITNFKRIASESDFLKVLARSIAPEIFGMESVKMALLLQMAGGSTLSTGDGLRIRGDLNVALIGDPGVAKSQLLKHIAHLSPRGIYTTGKGSSGAGLTASVTRDSSTGEISLEGGALVLADLGICCIDEFDKMQDNDRVAIHEVMEQQTISLAKAGITTSLNARASILAAANPVYGRYDRNRSPHENIGLPYSLLSRFDLIYILLDKSNETDDLKISRHIARLHQKCRFDVNESVDLSPKTLQNYVGYARTLEPHLPEHLHQYLVKRYVDLRKTNKDLGKFGQYITPRTLLAVIRFAIASAKLRLSEEVNQTDVETILSLMDMAQHSVLTEDEERRGKFVGKVKRTEGEQIKQIIKESFIGSPHNWIDMGMLVKSCMHRGFSREQLMLFLNEYMSMGFYMLQDDETKLCKLN